MSSGGVSCVTVSISVSAMLIWTCSGDKPNEMNKREMKTCNDIRHV